MSVALTLGVGATETWLEFSDGQPMLCTRTRLDIARGPALPNVEHVERPDGGVDVRISGALLKGAFQ